MRRKLKLGNLYDCDSDPKRRREGRLGEKFSKITGESLSQSYISEEPHVSQEWVYLSIPTMLSHEVSGQEQHVTSVALEQMQQWILVCRSWSPRSVMLPCSLRFARYMLIATIGNCMSNMGGGHRGKGNYPRGRYAEVLEKEIPQ